MTPNRIAAVAVFLTGLAGDVTALAGALPHGAAQVAGIIAGSLTCAASGLHFMTGAQKHEARTYGPQALPQEPTPPPALSAVEQLRAQLVAAGMSPQA